MLKVVITLEVVAKLRGSSHTFHVFLQLRVLLLVLTFEHSLSIQEVFEEPEVNNGDVVTDQELLGSQALDKHRQHGVAAFNDLFLFSREAGANNSLLNIVQL